MSRRSSVTALPLPLAALFGAVPEANGLAQLHAWHQPDRHQPDKDLAPIGH